MNGELRSCTATDYKKELELCCPGGILLVVGVLVFLLSYVLTSRAMKALLATVSITAARRQLLSRDLPWLPLLTPWVWLVGGAAATAVLQSSSILTSALVPLVSTRVITLGGALLDIFKEYLSAKQTCKS